MHWKSQGKCDDTHDNNRSKPQETIIVYKFEGKMQCNLDLDVGDVDNKILKIYINKKRKVVHTHEPTLLSLTYGRIFIFSHSVAVIFRLATRIVLCSVAAHSISVKPVCVTLHAMRVRRVAVNSSELQSVPASGNTRKIATNDTSSNFICGQQKRHEWYCESYTWGARNERSGSDCEYRLAAVIRKQFAQHHDEHLFDLEKLLKEFTNY